MTDVSLCHFFTKTDIKCSASNKKICNEMNIFKTGVSE